jgi:hypothetical protein
LNFYDFYSQNKIQEHASIKNKIYSDMNTSNNTIYLNNF